MLGWVVIIYYEQKYSSQDQLYYIIFQRKNGASKNEPQARKENERKPFNAGG